MTTALRRVVTGLDAEGRSCIAIDGPAETIIGRSHASPADNGAPGDAGGGPTHMSLPAGATQLSFHDFPPRSQFTMHATDTLDYLVILSGEVSLVTEMGETLMRPGDVVVDRGVLHNWRNDGDVPCRSLLVVLPAHPVGAGATMSGIVG